MGETKVSDVAARAGVSPGTVSNVLNHPHKVAPETVERVQRAIEELGFIRNDAARQLRDGRSRTIGLIVLDVRNPFFTDVARGAEDAAAKVGLSVTLGNSDDSDDREAAYLDLFEQQRVYGVLVSPNGDIRDRLLQLRRRGIPAVLVDRHSTDERFSSVSVDDFAGGRLAAEHLIAQGRTRLCFVGSTLVSQGTDRLAGARAAVADHPGVELEVVEIPPQGVAAGRTAGRRLAKRSGARRPDGIFAANDLVGIGVLQALVIDAQIRVPEEVALIGYDDIDFAATAIIPMSSIRQPRDRIGRTAVRLLLRAAENPTAPGRQVVFQPELVARASSVAHA